MVDVVAGATGGFGHEEGVEIACSTEVSLLQPAIKYVGTYNVFLVREILSLFIELIFKEGSPASVSGAYAVIFDILLSHASQSKNGTI